MYHHVAMLRYTETVEEAYHARVHDFTDRIRTNLSGIAEYHYCINVVDLPGAYTHAIIGVFDSLDSYAAYCEAPLHRELKDFMMQRAAEVMICDYDTSVRPIGSAEAAKQKSSIQMRLRAIPDTLYEQM